MNIADRSQANRAGWETRRKRMAAAVESAEHYELRVNGAKMINAWASYRKDMRDEKKKWEGDPPLGHDPSPGKATVRARKPHNAPPLPLDVFNVHNYRKAYGFASDGEALILERYTQPIIYTGDKWAAKAYAFQEFLGTIYVP